MSAPRFGSPLFWSLFVLAILKGFLFYGIAQEPFFLEPQIDGKRYHLWAQKIASGQWLSPEPFYQEPLYPYLLGLLYVITGPHLWSMALAQTLLSVLTAYLLFQFTFRLFDARAAWCTLLLYALFGMLYFYEIQPIKTTCVLFTTILFFHCCLIPSKRFSFFSGLTLGALILLRGNTFFLLPWFCLWKGFHHRTLVFWMLLGCAFPISLTTIHNYHACGEFILTSYQGGSNFYIGNNPKASGVYMPLRAGRQTPEYEGPDAVELASKLSGKPLAYHEVSRFWFQQAFEYLWNNPQEWLKLWLKKALLFFAPQEFPDGFAYRFFRNLYPWYHLFFVGYGLVCLLAIRACFQISYRHPTIQLLLFYWVGTFCSLVPFYIFSRYRLPVVIALLPLAGFACRYYRWLAIALVLGFLGEYALPWDSTPSHFILGNLYQKRYQHTHHPEDLKRAIQEYQNAVNKNLPFPEAWTALGNLYLHEKKITQAEYCFRQSIQQNAFFVKALYALGGILISKAQHQPPQERKRLLEEAQYHLEIALQEDPRSYQSLANLGVVYWNYWLLNPKDEKALAQAKYLIQQALTLQPEDFQIQRVWQTLQKY